LHYLPIFSVKIRRAGLRLLGDALAGVKQIQFNINPKYLYLILPQIYGDFLNFVSFGCKYF